MDMNQCLISGQTGPETLLHCSDTTVKVSGQIEIKCHDTLQTVKEEKTEKSVKQEPTELAIEGFGNITSDIKVEAEEEKISAGCVTLVHPGNKTHRENPGKGFPYVKSEEETCSYQNTEEKYQIWQQFGLKQEPSFEEPLKDEKTNTDMSKGTGPIQKNVTDTGVYCHINHIYINFILCKCLHCSMP